MSVGHADEHVQEIGMSMRGYFRGEVRVVLRIREGVLAQRAHSVDGYQRSTRIEVRQCSPNVRDNRQIPKYKGRVCKGVDDRRVIAEICRHQLCVLCTNISGEHGGRRLRGVPM